MKEIYRNMSLCSSHSLGLLALFDRLAAETPNR
jgi:hypothetical protein